MEKIKTATITFHASHNYGSMLQAYALQQVLINELDVDNEIINFRTEAQRKMYCLPASKKHSWKYKIAKIILGDKDDVLTDKYNLFERFLTENLILSPEFIDIDDLEDYTENFKFLITGSDQIWNTSCHDFNWVYYLPFAKNNAIAYSPSMGPDGKKQVKREYYSKINDCLLQYKSISVREQGTADVIKAISNKEVEVLIDPTLLVKKEIWDNLSGNEALIKGEYVFMYKPVVNDQLCKMSLEISNKTGLPVIVSNKVSPRLEIQYFLSSKKKLQYKLDVGPIEFLNLLKNAKIVISGSFHAVVFSIIFNKPFLAVGGKTDNRISQLLKSTDLLDYTVDSENFLHVLNELSKIDFTKAELFVEIERNKSLAFLKRALRS